MIELGRRLPQGTVKQHLAGGGFQQVSAANHLGDPHGGIIADYGQLVGGQIVGAPDDEIAEILSGNECLAAVVAVYELHRFTVRNPEAPTYRSAGGPRRRPGRRAGATGSRVQGLVFARM